MLPLRLIWVTTLRDRDLRRAASLGGRVEWDPSDLAQVRPSKISSKIPAGINQTGGHRRLQSEAWSPGRERSPTCVPFVVGEHCQLGVVLRAQT